MTVVGVAWTYLKGRAITSALTVFAVALGVSLLRVSAGAMRTARTVASSCKAQGHHQTAGEPQPKIEIFPAIAR
jgi:hypothetical protein